MAQFKECMESNGLDPKQGKEIFKKLHSGQDLEGDEKKNFGCANKCMMEKQGVWKDGKVDAAEWEKKTMEHPMASKVPNIKEAIQECSGKTGSDECDTAYEIAKCMKEKLPMPGKPE